MFQDQNKNQKFRRGKKIWILNLKQNVYSRSCSCVRLCVCVYCCSYYACVGVFIMCGRFMNDDHIIDIGNE